MNINLLTLSEITGVAGEAGDFTVTVRKKPRYIDMDKCIACGICAEKCPKLVSDEYNAGTARRKSAYIQYGQTVPLKYAIDPDTCIFIQKGKGKCLACEKFCPTGAINFQDKEELLEFNVGAVILSPGHKSFDPSGIDFYGYKTIPDVLTGLEYERMLSPSGPVRGHLEKPSSGKTPENIAWIQCVGSRNTNQCDNGYCSSVCCMYAMKQALVTETHIPGGGRQTIFFMDMRCHGKEFELYYNYATERGIRFIRARPHTIEPGPGGSGVAMEYFTEDGRKVREEFDLTVLSTGLEAPRDAIDLAEKTGIRLSPYRFAETGGFEPVFSSKEGIYIGGSFAGPMNIPTAVANASAAAGQAARALVSARNTLTKQKTYPPEFNLTGQKPKIGVFVCSCGVNIAATVDVNALVDYAKTLPGVAYAENNLFSCSTDAQKQLADVIRKQNLNRVVIAACSPRTHEPLFQDTLMEQGINGYLVEMANIRNHNAWVHQKNPEQATQKAKDQVRMAVAKAQTLYPLERMEVPVVGRSLVIGGGVAGMSAALGLADQGYDTVLVEHSGELGGNAKNLHTTARGEPIRPMLDKMIRDVQNHPKIDALTNARVLNATGSVGHFESDIEAGGETRRISYGAAVLATGASESVPDEYRYGTDDRVYTHLGFDRLMTETPEKAAAAGSAVFIQCVGSRDEKRPWCSRLCCTHSVKAALDLKEKNPEMDVFILYRDMRTYGLNEDLYTRARNAGVLFIRYDLENKPQVAAEGDDLIVRVFDPVSRKKIAIDTDLLILAAAVVPNNVEELVNIYRCATNQDGFLNEAHPKLRPVDMAADGLFVAGIGAYPKPIGESISQAQAAASRAGAILAQPVMHLDAIKSHVTQYCDGCAICLDACPYDAISITTHAQNGRTAKRVETDKALCKGCGICQAACPKGGILVHGFTIEQLQAQVHAALDLPQAMTAS